MREDLLDERAGLAPARMQQVVATFGPILQHSGSISDVPDPASLYTNEFVDPNIRMG